MMKSSMSTCEGNPAARILSARPSRRSISMLRALQRSILGRNCGASFCSIKTQRIPRRPRSSASVRPTGPAPTMRTWIVNTNALPSHFNDDFSVPDRGRIGLHRNRAGRQHHFAGANIELSLVKIALDNVAIDKALRQRAGAMGAMIVGDVKLPVDIEHRKFEAGLLDLDRHARSHVGRGAQFDLRCATGTGCGVS